MAANRFLTLSHANSNLSRLTVNPSFEAALFDIEYIKTQYEADLSEEIKTDDIEEVQKTIQEFKKRYQ